MTDHSIDTTRLAEIGDGSHALNNATRAIATNMQRWNGDSTVPVGYFAPDARELIDVGDAIALDSEAERLLAQGDHENGSLLREIAQASPQLRLVVAEVGRLGVRLAEALSLVEQLQGQLGTVRESLEYSTEENARLSASILDCGSDVHARVFDEEDDDDV